MHMDTFTHIIRHGRGTPWKQALSLLLVICLLVPLFAAVGSAAAQDDVGINLEKQADKTEVCPGETVNFTLITRLLGGAPGVNLRNIVVQDNNLPYDLDTTSAEFDTSSDVGGDSRIYYADANNDGINDEEFVWNYSLTITGETENIAGDLADVYFNDTFLQSVDNSNAESVTITINTDLCANGAAIIGNQVWTEAVGGEDSDFDAGIDTVQAGITLELVNADTNVVFETTQTDPNGRYYFTNSGNGVPAGNYFVRVTNPPTDTSIAGAGDPGSDTTDHVDDGIPDGNGAVVSKVFAFDGASNRFDIDFGFLDQASVDAGTTAVSLQSLSSMPVANLVWIIFGLMLVLLTGMVLYRRTQ